MSFFSIVRERFGALSQSQVDGFNVLLDATAGLPIRHRAYILATAFHETAHTMQPIHERGVHAYFDKYEPETKLGNALGNTTPGDGFKFRGRGYVQLTGRRNYAKAGAAVGADLLAYPDKCLEPAISAKIIVAGLTQGWFTSKKLSDYASFHDMRRTVNGLDCAIIIAGYAEAFLKALGSP